MTMLHINIHVLTIARNTTVGDTGNSHSDENYSNVGFQDRDVQNDYHLINEDISENYKSCKSGQ